MQALVIALKKQTSGKPTKMLGNNAGCQFLGCLPANQNANKQQNLTKQNNNLNP